VTETPSKQLQVELLVINGNKENVNDYSWLNTITIDSKVHDDKGTKYVLTNGLDEQYGNSAQIEFNLHPPANAKQGARR